MERRTVSSGSPYEALYGFSRAVRAGNRVHVSATAAIWPDGEVDPDPAVQAERCCEIIKAALEEAGASLADVVRTRVFYTDRADSDAIGTVHGKDFGDARPASGMIVVQGFIDPRWKVEIESDAQLDPR
jgi:enamine deaminase RidA (YjgF/YER057c/UK114 family)